MKKTLVLLTFLLILCGCGSGGKTTEVAKNETIKTPAAAPAKAADDVNSMYARAKRDVNDLGLAIYAYRVDEGIFPDVQSLKEFDAIPGFAPTYIKKVPATDPWGNEYYYEHSENQFKIGCGGSDGVFAGFGQAGGIPDLKPGMDIIWITDNFYLNPQESL
jgi:hypothetical protein